MSVTEGSLVCIAVVFTLLLLLSYGKASLRWCRKACLPRWKKHPHNQKKTEKDWKIMIVNQTGDGASRGKHVKVMLFQCMPDHLRENSYASALTVAGIDGPGALGPVILPTKVQFCIIDRIDDEPRVSGPFDVEFGQVLEVAQPSKEEVPNYKICDITGRETEIKVINISGNVQPLEIALYKSGRKLVSVKDVNPASAVYLAVKPAIHIHVVTEQKLLEPGEDFKADCYLDQSKEFALRSEDLNLKIGVTQKTSGELVFERIYESRVRRLLAWFRR